MAVNEVRLVKFQLELEETDFVCHNVWKPGRPTEVRNCETGNYYRKEDRLRTPVLIFCSRFIVSPFLEVHVMAVSL